MNSDVICAISGHRFAALPFGSDEMDPRCSALKKAIREILIDLIVSKGINVFRTGMALGCDQIVAETIIQLKNIYPQIKLQAFIPCREQYLKWNQAQSARYRALLTHVDDIIQVNDKYNDACMHIRNRSMVDGADILFAIYNGKKGGTSSTISYAQKQGLSIVILNPNKI